MHTRGGKGGDREAQRGEVTAQGYSAGEGQKLECEFSLAYPPVSHSVDSNFPFSNIKKNNLINNF